MTIDESYSIQFSHDDSTAFSIGKNLSKWDLATQNKTAEQHPLDDPSGLSVNSTDKDILVKNTSGVLARVTAETLRVLQTADLFHFEGCGPIFSPDPSRFVDENGHGGIDVLDIEEFRPVHSLRTDGVSIKQLRSVRNGKGLAFTAEPKWDPTTDLKLPSYITTVDWNLSNFLRLPFNFKSIFDFSTDIKSERWLIIGTRPKKGFVAEFYDLSQSEPLFSRQIEVTGSGFAGAINESRGYFCYTQPSGVILHDLHDFRILDELSIEYPCSLTVSPSGRYLGIGSWNRGLILAI